MIRYPQALDNIEAEATKKMATWGAETAARTALFAQLGRYTEEYTDPVTNISPSLTPFWSKVKPLYMERQHNKCVYCEQLLEGKQYGPVQWDLEHFRPKGRVRSWPTKKHKRAYTFSTGDESVTGYYRLAYSLFNYAASCKMCNSALKIDYFPVAANRFFTGTHPSDYRVEAAFLPYPLGTLDEDPEELITFRGANAAPKHTEAQNAAKWQRGQITIDFFALNRDDLVRLRAAWLLDTVWAQFKLATSGDEQAKKRLKAVCSPRAPFTSCSKQFLEVCQTDRAKAQSMTVDFEAIVDAMIR